MEHMCACVCVLRNEECDFIQKIEEEQLRAQRVPQSIAYMYITTSYLTFTDSYVYVYECLYTFTTIARKPQ